MYRIRVYRWGKYDGYWKHETQEAAELFVAAFAGMEAYSFRIDFQPLWRP